MDMYSKNRKELVEILRSSGISDRNVLDAIGRVKRESFVPSELKNYAYSNTSLPISSNQTISQPFTVAFMTQLLEIKPGDKVLEIGTGSGYQSAVLKEMGAEVFSVERIYELYKSAAERLSEEGYEINLKNADGTKGWPEKAPFDKIIVTAGSPKVPKHLLMQLVTGGKLVIPIGDENIQDVALVKSEPDTENSESGIINSSGEKVKFKIKKFKEFKFVPLIGEEGWS